MSNDTESTRVVLVARRDELMARLEELEKSVHHREEPLSADFAEQATELEDREVQEALDAEVRDELRQVNKALDRLKHGSYGTCEKCGEAIAPARLAALPFATQCIRCAA